MKNILTPKQKRFIDEYLVDLNASQAAVRSGFSPRTARFIGYRLLTMSQIKKAIVAAQRFVHLTPYLGDNYLARANKKATGA